MCLVLLPRHLNPASQIPSLGGTVDDTGRGARLKQAVGTEDTQRQTLLSSKGCDAVPPIHESSTGLSEILVLSCVRF